VAVFAREAWETEPAIGNFRHFEWSAERAGFEYVAERVGMDVKLMVERW
jgi:hypothetical protein